jgi:hypothetical protein
MIAVTKAYTTDHFPLGGNLSEEVLVLADGRAVYLNPGQDDEIYETLDDAEEACVGTIEASMSLLAAWSAGYDAPAA